jgi:hypothetical protein
MTVNRTTLLDLPLPVTGTESGTWGDTTNNGLSQYMDIAIAGMNSLTSANFTAGALTLANTLGDSSATNIAAGSAQYATIRVSSLAVNSTITAPSSNRSYRIINADATYSLTIKASGQTGVTFLPGQTGVVAFNGTDYVIVGVVGAGSTTDNTVPRFDGTTGEILQSSGVTIDDSNNVSGVAQLNITTLDATNIEVTNIKAKDGTAAASIADSTGVVSITANPILSGGTANGVLYLDGSKVATSGSALTFDGTTLTASASASTTGNFKSTSSTAQVFNLTASNDANTTIGLGVQGSASGVIGMLGSGQPFLGTAASALNIYNNNASGVIKFGLGTGVAEQMRLDSTGLGLGTSSPTVKLQVEGAANSAALTLLRLNNSGTTGGGPGIASRISFTASATALGYIQGSNFASGAVGLQFSGDGTNVQATLDSSGNLGLGTSSPGYNLEVAGGTRATIAIRGNYAGGTDIGHLHYVNANGSIVADMYAQTTTGGGTDTAYLAWQTVNGGTLSEKMNLTGSGNLGLGVTPSAWGSLWKTSQVVRSHFADYNSGAYLSMGHNAYESSGWKYIGTGNATLYQQSSGQHIWATAPSGTAGNAITFTQALTLDASGNLLLGGTSAGASSAASLAIFNGTAPTGSVTNGIILYAEDVSLSSELKVRDEAGNVTTLSPHNFSLIPEGPSEDMAWAYYSEKGGKRINVDMLKLARMVEKLTGEKLVYES